MKVQHTRLIEKYHEDQLSHTEYEELLTLIKEDEEFKQAFKNDLKIKGMISSLHAESHSMEDDIIAILDSVDQEYESEIIHKIENRKAARFPNWLLPALAAQFILTPIFYFIFTSFQTPQKSISEAVLIAKVNSTAGVSFIVRGDKKLNPKKGTELYSGDSIYVQDSSQLTLAYLDGSTLSVDEESFIKLSDKNQQKFVDIFSGEINADVVPQDKKMIINTEHATAEVLGTIFSVTSSELSSLLDVEEGSVRFSKGSESVLVNSQEYSIAAKEEPLTVTDNDKPIYKSSLITTNTPGHIEEIDVNIEGADKLYLVISNGGDNNRFDHGAWLNPQVSGPEGSIQLSDLPRTISKAGWNFVGINKGINNDPLLVEGQIYKNGIFVHATSIVAWDLPPGYYRFSALAAILDSGAYRGKKETVASMHFEVYTTLPEKKLKKLLIRRHHY